MPARRPHRGCIHRPRAAGDRAVGHRARPRPTPPPTADGTEPAAEPSGDAVVVGAVLEPTSLDIDHTAGAALDQVLLDNVYETLLKADETGEIGPGLAAAAGGQRRRHRLHVHASRRRDLPQRRSCSRPTTWSGRSTSSARPMPPVPPTSPRSRRSRPPTTSTVDVTLTQPDNDLLFNLTRRAGAVLRFGDHRPRRQRQRHRPVRPRRMERRHVDLARRERRLLGRRAGDRRRHVRLLHRPQRGGERVHHR